jgi:hypothetical protein
MGEGRWHALFAILGMIAGAALFAELYPFFASTVYTWKDFGRIGLPETLAYSPWIIVVVFWVVVIAMFLFLKKKDCKKSLWLPPPLWSDSRSKGEGLFTFFSPIPGVSIFPAVLRSCFNRDIILMLQPSSYMNAF